MLNEWSVATLLLAVSLCLLVLSAVGALVERWQGRRAAREERMCGRVGRERRIV